MVKPGQTCCREQLRMAVMESAAAADDHDDDDHDDMLVLVLVLVTATCTRSTMATIADCGIGSR